MSGPTLFIPGNLEATDWSPPKKELDQYVPLTYITNWFSEKYKGKPSSVSDRILILVSSTGSGKSTALPPELYHLFQSSTNKNIACTQPRVLTSIEIPKTILPYHTKEALAAAGHSGREPLKMGENIGFQNSALSRKPNKGIIYMTIGTLTQQLNIMTDEEFIKMYSIIILDECHERSLGADLCMFMMKKFIYRNYANPECPFFVTMSATFDYMKFCDYLLSDVKKPKRYENIIKVAGFTFPITEHFNQYDSPNYNTDAINTVIKIHEENSGDFLQKGKLAKDSDPKATLFRDILIFAAGSSDIKELKKKILDLNDKHPFFQKHPVLPLELSRDTVSGQAKDYKDLDKPIETLRINGKTPTRRVVLGTTVAETGITINTLKYVIDPGYHKSKEWNPNFSAEALILKPVTKGMYRQRRGRVGRKAPGDCYALYTKETMELMMDDSFPDIIKEDITLDLLNLIVKELEITDTEDESLLTLMKKEKMFNKTSVNLYDIDLMDLPSADNLAYSVDKLFTLGCIDGNSIPTLTGVITNRIRMVTIESIRMILAGYCWGVSIMDLIIIASFMQFKKKDVINDKMKREYGQAKQSGYFSLFEQSKESMVTEYNTLKTQLLIDDFIEPLLIFEEFQKKVQDENGIGKVKSWCESIGLKYDTLVSVIAKRDDIIYQLAMCGLNPYLRNTDSLTYSKLQYDSDKIKYITNLKYCIWEGYKCNLCMWDSSKKTYKTRKTHINLSFESEFVQTPTEIAKYGDNNPKFILFDSVNYQFDKQTNMYNPNVGRACILDGYIAIDTAQF